MSARVRLLLIVSLALNLFLAGAMVVQLGWLWSVSRQANATAAGAAGPAFAALPQERRRAFFAEIRRVAGDNRPLRREVRQARRAAARGFAAPAYDEAFIAAELRRANVAELELRGRIEAAVLRHGRELSLQERRALAPILERGLRRAANRRPGPPTHAPATPPRPAPAPSSAG